MQAERHSVEKERYLELRRTNTRDPNEETPFAGSKQWDEGIHLAEWVSSVSEEEWSSKVFDGEMGVRTSSEREVAKLLKIGLACCGEDVEKTEEVRD